MEETVAGYSVTSANCPPALPVSKPAAASSIMGSRAAQSHTCTSGPIMMWARPVATST